MIDILHHFLVEFCIPDESVGCTTEMVLDNPELLIVIGSRACRQLQLASIFDWNEFSYQNVDHWFRCGSLLPQADRSVAAAIICRRLCLSTCQAWIENSHFDAQDAWSIIDCWCQRSRCVSTDEHGWTTYDEFYLFQRCAMKPQLRIGPLGGISTEVLNFKVFTRILLVTRRSRTFAKPCRKYLFWKYHCNWWVVSLGMLASRLWRFGASLPVPTSHCFCGRLQEVWLRASPFRNEQPFCPRDY